jgi:hypothetical protein
MNKKILKYIQFLWLINLLMIVQSCVPNPTSTKATCGKNESFNNVTRACYSIVEAREIPVATLAGKIIDQEKAETVTLTYSDGNLNKASMCKIADASISSNIVVMSPQIFNKNIFTKADLAFSAVGTAVNSMNTGIDKTSALTFVASMQNYLTLAKKSYNLTILKNHLSSYNNAMVNTLALISANSTSNTVVGEKYTLAQNAADDFNSAYLFVQNNCDCVAGVCSTVLAPKRFKTGNEGFTYTVSDLDGESAPSVVAVTIAPMSTSTISTNNFLKPISKSQTYISFAESDSSTPSSTAFMIPQGTSYYSTNYSYKSVSTPVGYSYIPTAKGKITNCLGMNGSASNDVTCTYTPNNGDDPGTTATAIPTAASLTIGGALKFDALKAGIDGNSIKIFYKDISSSLTSIDPLSTTEQKFAYTGTLDEVYVRVSGNNIYVFFQDGISTFKQIRDALAADSLVNSLVNITLLVPETLTVSVAPASSGLSLSGGTTSYDSFAYTFADQYGTSTNTSSIVFRLTPTEDPPVWNSVAATSTTVKEDSGAITFDVSTTVTDVENNIDSCGVDAFDADNIIFAAKFTINSSTYDSGTKKCNIVVTPNSNVSSSSAYKLNYWISSNGKKAVDPTTRLERLNSYYITVTPVNDKPTLPVIAAATMNENSTNAPSASSTSFLVDAGGGVYEADQTLTISVTPATTSSTNVGVTLIPNQACQNYTAKSGTPIANSFAPTSSGEYYFDYTNKICYVSKTIASGATYTSSDWEYYPSITAFPNCGSSSGTPYVPSIDFSGKGSPTGISASVANKHYLDTKNNLCYISTGSTWKKDPTLLSYSIAYIPVKNQSGVASISVVLTDSGTNDSPYVDAFSNVNNDSKTFALTINPVNDPPYFITSPTKVETNEGGVIQTDGFMVDEDEGSTLDEDANDIWITEVKSDNQAVLPDSSISFFYDLNDNGIEETNESRAANASNTATSRFEVASGAGADANVLLHKFYFKLKPVSGITGNSNITFKLTDGTNTVSKSFSLLVHPIAALHGGWNNIFANGVKTDKNGAPAANSEQYCNYNKSTDLYKCDTTLGDCKGTDSPHSVVVPSHANVIFWDSLNKKCYRSQGTDKFSWIELNTTCPITRINVTSTSLVSSMTASDTTIQVSSTKGFPSGKNTLASLNASGHSTSGGYLKIGSEVMYYTGRTSGTFTGVVRAQLSTTASVHSAGEEVKYYPNGENFIFTSTGAEEHIPTADGQYAYDAPTKSCLYSKEKSSSPNDFYWSNQVLAAELGGSSDTYSPSSVTLSWNSFIMTGSGSASTAQVLAWNVYRREANKEYDFKFGALKNNSTDIYSVSVASTRTFTDKTAIAGKTYYYTIRPVDNYYNSASTFKFSTSTPEVFSEVRVYAPYANYGFIHRWMVNQEVCNGMHMTTSTTNKVDPTHNYRCPYRGPAEATGASSVGYYDVGKDLLVDINETGCPYSPAPKCSSNGCIGIGAPANSGALVADDMYYDRNSGTCYVHDGTNWSAVDSTHLPTAAKLAKTNTALNAPLVNIERSTAANVCSSRNTNSVTSNLVATASLPTKAEYIAYAASPSNLSDSEITDLEQGYSLNIQSRCNSTSASGLDGVYNDSTIPSTSLMFTISGTASSGIRSLYTGSVPWGMSYSTQSCISKYGIQDVYGNVSEWIADTMTCTSASHSCSADNVSGYMGEFTFTDTTYGPRSYGFDLYTGPYNDADTTGTPNTVGDAFLPEWDFRDELYGAGKFSFPIGMPISTEIATYFSTSTSIPYILDIGPTSGITSNQLHEDGIIVNNDASTTNAGFVVGGGYLSGNRSGRFSSEMISTTNSSLQKRTDVGVRCIIRMPTSYGDTSSAYDYSY